MKLMQTLLLDLALLLVGVPVFAGETDPLFINMTTDDGHRANMAITFGMNQMERGHPLTLFLNDKGVYVASKANDAGYAQEQKMLAELAGKGATIIACPMCMKHYGVQEQDLLPGIQVGKPALTGAAQFKDNTKTLTW